MDIDSAMEEVALGAIARRRSWPVGEAVYPLDRGGASAFVEWRSSIPISLLDTVAEDWELMGRLQ